MRAIATVVAFVASFSAFAAQRFTGTVLDQRGNPIAGATVASPQATGPDTTKTNGEFALTLGDGVTSPVTISISHPRFKVVTALVEIPQTTPFLRKLEPLSPPAPAPPTPRPSQPSSEGRVLQSGLQSPTPADRIAALKALAAKGNESLVLVAAIARALRDPDAAVQLEAAATLEKLRPDDRSTSDALLLALTTRSQDLQCAAANALRAIDPMSPAFLRGLKEVAKDAEAPAYSRVCVAKALLELTGVPTPEIEQAVIGAMHAGNTLALELAISDARLLRRVASTAGMHVLEDHALFPRALEAVAKLDDEEQANFIDGFSNAEASAVSFAFADEKSVSPAAYALFRRMIRKWLSDVSLLSCDDLAWYGATVEAQVGRGVLGDAESIRLILHRSRFEDWTRCKSDELSLLLTIIGDWGTPVVASLHEALADDHRADSDFVARALYLASEGNDESAIRYLAQYWRDDVMNELLRLESIDDDRLIALAVGAIQRDPRHPEDIARLRGSVAARKAAAHAFADGNLPALVAPGLLLLEGVPLAPADYETINFALRSLDQETQKAAMRVLVAAAPDSVAWILKKLNGGPDDDRATQLLVVLHDIGAASQPAIPTLISIVRDKHSPSRAAAARALGAIGLAASAAVRYLVPLTRDADENVSTAAEPALSQIQARP